LDFILPESPEVTANNLNKFLASFVKSLPVLSFQLPTDDLPPAFPSISPSEMERRIGKLRKTSVCPLDIPFPLIIAFSDFLQSPCLIFSMKILSMANIHKFGNKVS
jgi:hypothetical protein